MVFFQPSKLLHVRVEGYTWRMIVSDIVFNRVPKYDIEEMGDRRERLRV